MGHLCYAVPRIQAILSAVTEQFAFRICIRELPVLRFFQPGQSRPFPALRPHQKLPFRIRIGLNVALLPVTGNNPSIF
jgi:hypothetical protein